MQIYEHMAPQDLLADLEGFGAKDPESGQQLRFRKGLARFHV